MAFAIVMFVLHTAYSAIGKIAQNKHFYNLCCVARTATDNFYPEIVKYVNGTFAHSSGKHYRYAISGKFHCYV